MKCKMKCKKKQGQKQKNSHDNEALKFIAEGLLARELLEVDYCKPSGSVACLR